MKKQTLSNKNILVPRNLEGRKEKLRKERIKLLSQEVIEGDLHIDETFLDVPKELIKIKEITGSVVLSLEIHFIPEWLKDVKIYKDLDISYCKLKNLKNCPRYVGRDFECHHNFLKSLKNCPDFIGRNVFCQENSRKLNKPKKLNNTYFVNTQRELIDWD